MPIYWIFILAAIAIAVSSDQIDQKVNANGKLKKVVISICIAVVILLSFAIKIAL